MLVWLPVVPSVPVFFHISFEMITGALLLWHPGQCHEFSFRSSQEPIFALTFLAAFLEPPPGSLALVPVVSGNFCGKERGHFQALEREGADRNGPLALCYLGQRSSISLSFLLSDLRVFSLESSREGYFKWIRN